MFENTLNLVTSIKPEDGTLLGANTIVPTFHVKTEGTRTFRESGAGHFLSIGHAPSKENPGFDTQRSVVRLERVKPVPDSDRSTKAVVQFGFSIVKEETTVHELRVMVCQLIGLLIYGSNVGADYNHGAIAQVGGTRNGIDRLYVGEP